MGTSVEQIDRTYGHLLPDTLDRARGALDAFLGASRVDPGYSNKVELGLNRCSPMVSGTYCRFPGIFKIARCKPA